MRPRLALLAAVLSLPALTLTAAASSDGWDWDEELADSEWTDDSLDWAVVVHPEHPSEVAIERRVLPPPQEPWCQANVRPSAEDCAAHRTLLEEWLQDEIGKSPSQAASAAATYPSECWSACYP